MLIQVKNPIQKNPVLRQHQNDALAAIRKIIRKGEGKGRIVLPTGTGKTRIEAETICEIFKDNKKREEWRGVYENPFEVEAYAISR